MIKKAAIVNYGAGNLMSITKAVETLDIEVEIIHKAVKKTFDIIILPGVGNFGSAMRYMKQKGLYEEIKTHIMYEKPLLGICLGLQLLFEKSEEAPTTSGFKAMEGDVVRFKSNNLPIPHMCWNIVEFKDKKSPLIKGLRDKEFFYFVHSYYPVPKNKDIIFGTTFYSERFCSMVVKDNIVATQFHLEKSGLVGLKLLKNIINYFNKC